MKTKKASLKVIALLLFLFMVTFVSCEEECWTCINAEGDTIEACSESARDIWEGLDFVCTQN
ncbi:MAG: hypothetical protein MUC78_03915 [Bacteroidales bacterium]|nr:hypothetical protein [Bacteroidales bacterium]